VEKYFGKIIDVHTHVYPERIALKATQNIGEFYEIPMNEVGLFENLAEIMKKTGICKTFILSTAVVPKQVRAINDYLIEFFIKKGLTDTFTLFGTVHPDMENPCDEIDYCVKNGIKGLKFHSDFLKIAVDDPRMDCIYDLAQDLQIPIMFHAGDCRYNYTNPSQFVKISKKYPRLIGIAAHLGGYSQWDEVLESGLLDTNFWYDTSSSMFCINPDIMRKIFEKSCSEKIMFGSDFPMWNASNELNNLAKYQFSDTILEKVLYKNALEFLKIID